MPVSLRIVHPRDVVQTIALEAGRALVIGRAANEPDVCCIPNRTVSRAHVRLEEIDGAWTVRDLGSHNGSWCDGVRLGDRPLPLKDGAVLRMGDAIGVVEHATPSGSIRRSEILAWLDTRAAAWAEARDRSIAPFDLRADAAETIVRFAWSGDVDELDRLVHALVLAGDCSIALAHLPGWLRDAGTEAEAPIDDPTKDDAG